MAQKIREQVTLKLGEGEIGIRHAKCPRGCDLMDASELIHGLPSIKVRCTAEGKVGVVHLDPLYGLFENIHESEPAPGTVAEFGCPHCGVSLQTQETCQTCAGPLFELQLPGGIVEGCLRNGCHYHRLTIIDRDTLMQRLFAQNQLDAYL